MSDETYPGGPVMIKIDGSKIRRVREQKGLTQLYIATAVEVTTDTVSRWENKRYPTIKKENGIKLAEALEVSLDEILDLEPESEPVISASRQDKIRDIPTLEQEAPLVQKNRPFLTLRTGLLIFLMVLPLMAVMIYLLTYSDGNVAPETTVNRTVSPHFIPGQPLPVFIQISTSSEQPVSFILRETLPPGTTIHSTYPQISIKHKKDNLVQWIGNITESALFIYTVSTDEKYTGSITFDGIMKINSSGNHEIAVTGNQQSSSNLYHWADKDKDNRISDEEILTIYDLANSVQFSEIDMDQLEEIWLGDGYIWQPDEMQYSIRE